jgi:1-acyl-sn-glycerol-3-phosphate acyltransferase
MYSPAPNNFVSVYGSRRMGVFRVVGFFTLIGILVPAYLIYDLIKPKDQFRIPMLFYRSLCRLLSFGIRVQGDVSETAPTLFAANHSSYLDIIVLGALIPASFVAKAEVARWPMIGQLGTMLRTVFIERNAAKAAEQSTILRDLLLAKRSLILFPEGTSSDGMRVLPFKSSLFSIAKEGMERVDLAIQPVSITCSGIGGLPIAREWRPYFAWFGDMTFTKHLWDAFCLGGFRIDVVFHPPVKAQDFNNRKSLAQYCQNQVSGGIQQSLKGRELFRIPETKRLAH